MRKEEEIEQLRNELEKILDFIAEFGDEKDFEEVSYIDKVIDTLDWVLERITTLDILDQTHINMDRIKEIVKNIERRTGKKLEEYSWKKFVKNL